jgi:hypothetical protein
VHLNGRVYDPYIGRMTSADPIVGDPLNGQAWNRYSYVWNNPLAYTDPTGYCPGACIGYVNPEAPRPSALIQLIQSVFQIAVAAMCTAAGPGCAPFLPLVVGVLKAGIIAGATAVAFNIVGEITSGMPGAIRAPDGTHGTFVPFSEGHLVNIAGHALVGCASTAASGGKCGAGALSAGVTAFAGPLINERTFSVRSVILNSTLGGLASIAGGGKFANGAVTGAFGYLLNSRLHCNPIGCPPMWGAGSGGGPVGPGLTAAVAAWMAGLFGTPGSVGDEQIGTKVHGNSSNSMQGTELYYLINRSSGAIDKIGITSYPNQRRYISTRRMYSMSRKLSTNGGTRQWLTKTSG